jgi:hypothetical protein
MRPVLVLALAVLGPLPVASAASAATSRFETAVPHVLPRAQAGAAAVEPATWLVGARPGRRADVAAARLRARKLTDRGVYMVARHDARALAREFRRAGVYRFAEPDRELAPSQAPMGGDDFAASDWRPVINPPAAPPPPADAPLTAVIDDAADTTHPDLAGVQSGGLTAFADWHGTAVASLIAGRANGFGMVGVYPGAPVTSFGTTLTFGDVARRIADAVDAGARIVNLSLGGDYSYAIELELTYAVSQGVLAVAAAGNDRYTVLPDGSANPVIYPAALPHVLSVASMGPTGASSEFSTSNGAVDVSAPGEGVLAAVPFGMDPDSVPDGFARVDGTSFAAPIVAGAAAWVRAARPGLGAGQTADLLRITARDLGRAGWDEDSGYGVIDLQAALTEDEPAVDPGEVNDDIPWVNGTRFTRPDPLLFRKRNRRRRIDAHVDLWKDPADVYRIQVAGRTRLRVILGPASYADADLEIYTTRGRTIYRRRGRIAGSYRPAGKLDHVFVPAARRTRVVYAVVFHAGEQAAYLDAPYRLTIERARR